MLRLVPVTDRRTLRRFVDLPFALYDAVRYPNWVPPLKSTVYDALDEAHHPFYREATRACWLVERDGRDIGRIVAIENRAANRQQDARVGYWGFFECTDDTEAAALLFDTARAWLAARGLTSMLGPMNPSTNYECGLLVGGYEHRPTFMTAWNPPFYDTLCEGAGLRKAKDLLGMWIPVGEADYAIPPLFDKLTNRALRDGRVQFRQLEPRHFERELKLCWGIYNAAWEANWGFVQMPYEEFRHMAKDMRFLVAEKLSFLATVDGVPAGFMLAVPDYNEVLRFNRSGNTIPFGLARMLWQKRVYVTARVMALGVAPEFRNRGILAVLAREIALRGMARNGKGAEASWLLEDNVTIVQPMVSLGARERMRWRLYEGSTS
jgi:GNAT superfamily N-acetyltransferase